MFLNDAPSFALSTKHYQHPTSILRNSSFDSLPNILRTIAVSGCVFLRDFFGRSSRLLEEVSKRLRERFEDYRRLLEETSKKYHFWCGRGTKQVPASLEK